MSEDVKPKLYYIVDSSQLNNQPTRVYNIEPKWLVGAVEWSKVIELEPTMRLIDELAEPFQEWLDDTEVDFSEQPGWKSCKEVLEKYRKFKDGLR